MSSLWKESTQGVSTLLREIGSATAVVPGFIPRADVQSDPLPVLPRSTSAGTDVIQLLMHAVYFTTAAFYVAPDECFYSVSVLLTIKIKI